MAVQQRHEIPREEWSGFFEGVTKEHAGQDVTIEVLAREFGDGHEARRPPPVDNSGTLGERSRSVTGGAHARTVA